MPRKLHIANAAGRDATVAMDTVRPPPPPPKGLAGGTPVRFVRWLAGTVPLEAIEPGEGRTVGQALVDGDPEWDLERAGREVGPTDRVYLTAQGDVLYASPRIVEVILDRHGEERERRDPQEVPANVTAELPVRWTGLTIPVAEAVRRFAFSRTLQVRHVDGLTYDYLHAMATQLAESGALVRVGAGPRGRAPLVFQHNGSPWQGFLEGRVDGERYQLLLHLSHLELRRPDPPSEVIA